MYENKKRSVKVEGSSEENTRAEEISNSEMDINADSEIPGTTHLPDPMENEDELTKLKEDAELNKDKYLRLLAEFDNYKRRSSKERIDTLQTAGREIITSLLEVMDDMDRAENQLNTSDNIDQLKQGVQLVFNKLRNTLYAKGLKPMISVDTDFDVEKHEAITEVPVTDESRKGKVVDEIIKGYYLNDKLIRFAKVVVGK